MIKKGVLQGGVLSPELFNRFINDLANELKKINVKIYLYADDLGVIFTGKKKAEKII